MKLLSDYRIMDLSTLSFDALHDYRRKAVVAQQKEYQTRGNTQKCQELFEEIQKIQKEIDNRKA